MSRALFVLSRAKFQNLSRTLFIFHGHFFSNLSRAIVNFHGQNSGFFFTGTFLNSRALFRKMSRALRKVSRGKKKNTALPHLHNEGDSPSLMGWGGVGRDVIPKVSFNFLYTLWVYRSCVCILIYI